MKVGFSTTDITPSYGMGRPGSTEKVFHNGVHDDCLASACVIDDGDHAIAVVGIDALSVPRSIVQTARRIITDAIGIPGEHVMASASHTHAGGPIAARAFGAEPNPAYREHVAHQIATAVIDAQRRAENLWVGVGVGEAQGVAYPRRWHMRDGTVWSHPGSTNPDAMDSPQGEVDPSVGVIGVADAKGALCGCIVNFACHGTTGLGVDNTASADWVYFLRRTLKDVFGPNFGVVFLNGASGDVTQVDNTDPGPHWSGPLIARRVGMTVAGEVIKVLVRTQFREHVSVAGKSAVVRLTPRVITREMLAWAQSHQGSREMVQGRWFSHGLWATEWIALAQLNEDEPEIHAEVQSLTVGEAALVSTPAELFCDLGRDIRRRSKFQPTFVVSLSNGCIGYVGPRDSYADDYIPRVGMPMTGGFETIPAPSSKCAPGSGERIADALVELTNSMPEFGPDHG